MKYTIEQLNHAYHTLGQPLVSDAEYDRIAAGQPIAVGAPVASGSTKIRHAVPMLSITSRESLTAFGARVGDVPVMAEPKIDGVAISLTYSSGRLVQAATRGDGKTGMDITAHALAITGIPSVLTESVDIEVRGEVYMPRSVFSATEFSTARSAVVGSLQLKDSAACAARGLRLFAFQLFGDAVSTQSESLARLSALGLPVNTASKRCKSITDCSAYFAELESLRDSLDYDIDGVVFKVDSLALQTELDSTRAYPLWAIARKFAAATVETVIESIEYGTGKTGRQTAVAIVSPVTLGNKTIQRVNVHNPMHVAELGLGAGARVVLKLSNDVIAHVSHAIDKVAYTGPALPEKVVIGPSLSFDIDELNRLMSWD